MQALIDVYMRTLQQAVEGEDVNRGAVLQAYRKIINHYFSSRSGVNAKPSDAWWGTPMGQLLARARIKANGDLLTMAEFARVTGSPFSTVSYWVKTGKIESIVDPDNKSTSPTGGGRRLIPRSELNRVLTEQNPTP